MKRKNPRHPVRVATGLAQLDRLWRMQGGPAGWPILSAETLWRFQYAGLHHMIRRGDLLAERWLAALEAAARIVRGPVLGIPDATLTATRARPGGKRLCAPAPQPGAAEGR